MKIILLGKGGSINLINKDIILEHDEVAWANLHDHIKNSYIIPAKVDYLFIRQPSFVNDLILEQQNAINELEIKHVLTTGVSTKKILKYNVESNLSHNTPYNFNASTGLIAFNYLVGLKPESLTICGIDLFMKDKNIYYFENIGDSLSSKQNNKNIKAISTNDGKLKTSPHDEKKTIAYIKQIITDNKKINFTFYTINDELKEELKGFDNVILK